MQETIFDIIFEKYTIKKPIRLIEFFGGVGSQYKALKLLGANVEHHKLVEWAVNSIQAYNDVHYKDYYDYSSDKTKEQLIEYLYDRGISTNYNDPLDLKQIQKKNEQWLRTVYNNIIATNNLVNIQKTKGEHLEITDKDKYEYIITYSFPCQDLSLAGLRKGMSRDSGTRSGMLWEVERILDELNELNQLPQVLLMENVPQVHGKGNIEHFIEWQEKLESLGYKNYWKDLIATDYGIPQIRNRTFMVSIQGDYNYTFPEAIPLKRKLKDMLEEQVDEKYYLSDKQIGQIASWNAYEKPLEHLEDEVVGTLTTRSGDMAAGMKLVKEKNLKTQLCNNLIEKGIVKENDVIKHNYTSNKLEDKRLVPTHDISPTLDTRADCLGVVVPEATKKGYAIAHDGDGVYTNRPHQKRGVVQKDKIQTLKTSCDDLGVVVGTYQYAKSDNFMKGKNRFNQDKDVSDTIQTTPKEGIVYNNLRIRKLTPKECFRLMGFSDSDYESINLSDSAIYHIAGDSIVVTVLMAIFGGILNIEYSKEIEVYLSEKQKSEIN